MKRRNVTMKKFKVNTPNESFAGTRLGVKFYKGEAETELTDVQVNQFKAFGYTVEEIKAPKKSQPKKQKETEK
jgi:hypothetical protein